jgi:multimeric flavodoxin WrbA
MDNSAAAIPEKKPRIVIINGSLHGDSENSNTYAVLLRAKEEITKRGGEAIIVSPELVTYKHGGEERTMWELPVDKVLAEMEKADGVIVGTGTYWGSRSSVLQRFFEDDRVMDTYGTSLWEDKPGGVIVCEHSIGSNEIVKGLKQTLGWFGCLSPSRTELVVSRVAMDALAAYDGQPGKEYLKDIYQFEKDLSILCARMLEWAKVKKPEASEDTSWDTDDNPASVHERWVPGREHVKGRVGGPTKDGVAP